MTNYVFIDGSYFIFFRYYALLNWWKLARKDVELGEPIENEEFVERFKTIFKKKIVELLKKLKLEKAVLIAGRDCSRQDIWRMKYLPSYKATRDYTDFKGGPFFKMVYEECLFQQAGVGMVIKYNSLEADDVIAIMVRYIRKTQPNDKIYIITADMDYLQLYDENIYIYNLKYKQLKDSKNCLGDPKLDLFVKIVTGDKSDNIKSVFKKCGVKTAIKLFNNQDEFNKKLEKEEGAKERYELNKKLIDFNEIPSELVESFKSEVLMINN